MDLVAARADGISFFTHKATEGTTTRHVHFAEAIRRARAAGIPVVGAYGIPRTPGNGGNQSISAQVDYFLSYLAGAPPVDFIQCDLEHWSNASGVYDAVTPTAGAAWCEMAAQRSGKKVVLYAPSWAYGNTIPQPWPLWQSSYGTNLPGHYLERYPGDSSSRWNAYSGRAPVILQYGSSLNIGSQAGCDANAFRGTLKQLQALIGIQVDAESETAMQPLVLVRLIGGSGEVWLSDLLFRRSIPSLTQLSGVQSQMGAAHLGVGDGLVHDVDDLDAFGVDVATFVAPGPGAVIDASAVAGFLAANTAFLDALAAKTVAQLGALEFVPKPAA
jgi:hypothetical protein